MPKGCRGTTGSAAEEQEERPGHRPTAEHACKCASDRLVFFKAAISGSGGFATRASPTMRLPRSVSASPRSNPDSDAGRRFFACFLQLNECKSSRK